MDAKRPKSLVTYILQPDVAGLWYFKLAINSVRSKSQSLKYKNVL